MEQRVAGCPECAAFVDAVKGIRGSYWHGRKQAGRRLSYRVVPDRAGAVTVSGEFFPLLHNTCARWLGHLHEQHDLCEHTSGLPAWIRRLLNSVSLATDPEDGARYFARQPDVDAAACVGAAVLGIGVRAFYEGLAEGLAPTAPVAPKVFGSPIWDLRFTQLVRAWLLNQKESTADIARMVGVSAEAVRADLVHDGIPVEALDERDQRLAAERAATKGKRAARRGRPAA